MHLAGPQASVGQSDIDDYASEDLWVFGYGSLMWRPGFETVEALVGRVDGFHRALCIYSYAHRGTPERPGLVVGLDRGGYCQGMAFRVDACKRRETIAYLREREQITMVYREVMVPVALADGSGRCVEAITYVADQSHKQYAGLLPMDRQLEIVLAGQGKSGANIDYVLNTVEHLWEMGLEDEDLSALYAKIKASNA